MAFAKFPEQEQSIQLLQRSLERGRLAHAYLLTGDDLVHLEAVARTLAMTVNCAQPVRRGDAGAAVDCCGRCSSCRRTAEDNHPDVGWVRPESKMRIITIEQVREVIHTVNLKPAEGGFKVSVLVAADRLNVAAANAFLKTLEEPPPRSVLILLSREPQRLLETILSRCLRLNFAGDGTVLLGPGEREWLQGFADLCVSGKSGLLGRYKLLGLLLGHLGAVKAEIDTTLTARSPLEKYPDVEADLREKWEDELTAAIESEYRARRAGLLMAVEWWLRDVWCQKVAAGEDLLALPELAAPSRVIAGRISVEEAVDNLRSLEQTQRFLATNVQESLALEVGLLKLRL